MQGPLNNLVGYWPFDSGQGGLLFDHSGNHNHGVIHGATWVNGHSWLNPRIPVQITGTSGFRMFSSPVSGTNL